MKCFLAFCLLAAVLFPAQTAWGEDDGPLPRATPEEVGVPVKALCEFVRELDAYKYVHGFMVLRHGKVIAEGWRAPYSADDPHMLFSGTKSFTAVAIGMVEDDGKLSVNDKLVKFFPHKLSDKVSPEMRTVTLHNLLTMASGHDQCPLGIMLLQGNDMEKAFLESKLVHKPGSRFVYNNGASYMLSATVRAVTGRKLSEFLDGRLFKPLGIRNYRTLCCPSGNDYGAFGFSIRTEDFAKFGQLLLQKGVWGGKRLVSAGFVERASGHRIDKYSGDVYGYGYQFWGGEEKTFRADGAHGQYSVVCPEKDMVVAVNNGTDALEKSRMCIMHLLSKVKADGPLPPDPQGRAELGRLCNSLAFPALKGDLQKRSGAGEYRLSFNIMTLSRMRIAYEGDVCRVRLTSPFGARHEFTAGFGRYLRDGKVVLPMFNTQKVAAQCAWTAADTLTFDIVGYESPFQWKYTLVFGKGGKVSVDINEPEYLHQPGKRVTCTGVLVQGGKS